MWPAASKRTFLSLLEGAERTVLLQRKRPDSRQQAGAALARRDGWLATQVDEAIVVWDGVDARIGRSVRALEDALDGDVWIIEPGS